MERKKANAKADLIEWNTLEAKPMQNGLINQFLWKDSSAALFLSTVFTGEEEPVMRMRKKPKTKSASRSFSRPY